MLDTPVDHALQFCRLVHPPSEDGDIDTFLIQELYRLGGKETETAAEAANPDRRGIFVDCGHDDIARSVPLSKVNDLESCFDEMPGHQLHADVVAVQADLGEHHPMTCHCTPLAKPVEVASVIS